MKLRFWQKYIILALGGLAACQPGNKDRMAADNPATSQSQPVIYAVNYPLAWMAERLAGANAEVVLPVPAGVDPAHWQPSPEAVLEYQQADLVLLNGAGYAAWVQLASLSAAKQVDSTRGLEARLVQAGEVTHTHGPQGQHDHGNVASHTWLDPMLAAAQAAAVANALTRLIPAETASIESNLVALQADLEQLDRGMQQAADHIREFAVWYSHPVYQYLDARYELDGVSVSWEPDAMPPEIEWQSLARQLDGSDRPIMIWEAEPRAAIAERLQELGMRVIVFETGNNRPAEGDYLQLMRRNVERMATMEQR